MDRSSRRAPVLALAVALGATAALAVTAAPPPTRADEGDAARRARLARAVTIRRDRFGVPHVHGRTDAAAVFGFMYARAEDELYRIEDAVLRMLGRSAEAHGEAFLASDRMARALEIPRRAREQYERAAPEVRALCDAFADGLEHFRAAHPAVRARALERFEPWHAMALELGFQHHLALQAAAELRGEARSPWRPRDGSNVWAVGPSRSASGHALVLINPHIPMHEVYEAHLRSDEGWNVSGGVAYGRGLMPMFGHNASLAWSLTVNYPDVVDVYIERFDHPDDPLRYRHGERWRTAEEWTETIRVRTAKGIDERDVTLRKTHHGPIVAEVGGRPAAVRVARLDEGGLLAQWYAMTRAEDVAAFERALAIRGLVMHNVMAADRAGDTLYVYNGAIPRRDPRFDWSRPVDGADPRTEWRGYHEIAELPRVKSPAAGWMQSCNSRPFTTTAGDDNPDPKAFPSYLVGADVDDPRVTISRRILAGEKKHTFEGLIAAAFDDRVVLAETLVPQLLADAKALAGRDAAAARRLAPLLEALGDWDRRARTDSVGATLFLLALETLGELPPERRATAEGRLAALAAAARWLEDRWGTWRVEWGEVNRHQRPIPLAAEPFSDARASWPIGGGHGAAGVVWNVIARPTPGGKRRYAFHGHSYLAVVELGEKVRARSIVPYGASRVAASPHHLDQAPLFARGELKPAWFHPDEVAKNTERSYHPGRTE